MLRKRTIFTVLPVSVSNWSSSAPSAGSCAAGSGSGSNSSNGTSSSSRLSSSGMIGSSSPSPPGLPGANVSSSSCSLSSPTKNGQSSVIKKGKKINNKPSRTPSIGSAAFVMSAVPVVRLRVKRRCSSGAIPGVSGERSMRSGPRSSRSRRIIAFFVAGASTGSRTISLVSFRCFLMVLRALLENDNN